MGIPIESTSTKVDTWLSRFALARIIDLMFLGSVLAPRGLHKVAFEEADNFGVEAAELTKGVSRQGSVGA